MHKLLFFCQIQSTIIINHSISIQNEFWLKAYRNWHLATNPVHQDLVNASLNIENKITFVKFIEINNK